MSIVCLFAEPIRTKFVVKTHMSPGKVYELSIFKHLSGKYCYNL